MSFAYVAWDGLWWLNAIGVVMLLWKLISHQDDRHYDATEVIGIRIVALVIGGFYAYWLTVHVPWSLL